MIDVIHNLNTSATTASTNNSKNDVSNTSKTVAMNGIVHSQHGPIRTAAVEQEEQPINPALVTTASTGDNSSSSSKRNSSSSDNPFSLNATASVNNSSENTATQSTSSVPVADAQPLVMVSLTSEEYPTRPSRESVLQRLSEALLRRSLTQIDLSQRGLQPSDARLVKMALSQNANLTVLKLGYNDLRDDGIATLAGGIATHKSLRLLDLGFNNVGDDGIRALANAMSRQGENSNNNNNNNNNNSTISTTSCSNLRTLYLAGNLIREDGAMSIADMIRQGASRIQKLYMTGNRIGGAGVKAITDAILEKELSGLEVLKLSDDDEEMNKQPLGNDDARLKNTTTIFKTKLSSRDNDRFTKKSSFRGMQELFLGGTGMGSTGCNAVAQLLESSTSLRVISLPNCDMGDEEIGVLAASIKVNKSRLPVESIQLSFNNMTQTGLESLANALWGSTTLRELHVDNNQISDRGAHHVASIVPTLPSLEVLDVGFNSIKAGGLVALMKTVAETNQLLSLSISGNAVDVNGAKAVAYALAYNCSLKSIFLVHCSVAHDGQRHIVAGIVSNSRTALSKLTGIEIGPIILTLGFPEALRHWTNKQILNFIHLMWDQNGTGVNPGVETALDLAPLSFLPNLDNAMGPKRALGPIDASVVVDVAKKAFENLVANGVDVFSRRSSNFADPSFGCPLASGAIMVESSTDGSATQQKQYINGGSGQSTTFNGISEPVSFAAPSRSFVVPPESKISTKNEAPDPARKKRVVEWLCSNIQHLNELAQLPFNPRELWKLHQHYFSPVVNESGGACLQGLEGGLIVSSVPEVNRAYVGGSAVTPSTASIEEQFSVPLSDPVLPGVPDPSSMKRKVSYRHLGDAVHNVQMSELKLAKNFNAGSVAKLIEHGHTGHSLPPKTKRARRNRTRISFLPRVKAKLDGYLDVCHEKALITMRQLYFVEHAILAGQVNPLEIQLTPRTHLSGTLASEAEMIVVDMI